jgi:hypothetical protein
MKTVYRIGNVHENYIRVDDCQVYLMFYGGWLVFG